MTFQELQSFLREEQEDPRVEDPTYVNALFRDFSRVPSRSNVRQPSLTLNEVGSFSVVRMCEAITVCDGCGFPGVF